MAPAVVALLPRRRPPCVRARHLRGGGAAADDAPALPLAAARSLAFWSRASRIYASYKLAQLRAGVLRAQARRDTQPACNARGSKPRKPTLTRHDADAGR